MAINSVRVPASKGDEGSFVSFDGGAAFDFQCTASLAVHAGYGSFVFFVVGGDGDASFG